MISSFSRKSFCGRCVDADFRERGGRQARSGSYCYGSDRDPEFSQEVPITGGLSPRDTGGDLSQLQGLERRHIFLAVGDAAADLAKARALAPKAPALQRAWREAPARGQFGLQEQACFHQVLRVVSIDVQTMAKPQGDCRGDQNPLGGGW